jgi:molecular chaperone HtpG
VLQELAKLAESDPAKYRDIWKNFGAPLKEGLYEEPERRDALFALARFVTSTRADGDRTLAQYVADFRPNQTAIYYLTGADGAALATSPHLEGFRARGIEVLLLSDPVDAFWISTAVGYDGKPFRSISQGRQDIDQIPLAEGEAEQPRPELDAHAATFLARMKEALAGHVSDVRASTRLSESAACIVASDRAPDRTLAKILAGAGRLDASFQPVLEVNLGHPLLRALAGLAGDAGNERFAEASRLIFDLAQIAEGEAPENAPDLARRLSRWMTQALKANATD